MSLISYSIFKTNCSHAVLSKTNLCEEGGGGSILISGILWLPALILLPRADTAAVDVGVFSIPLISSAGSALNLRSGLALPEAFTSLEGSVMVTALLLAVLGADETATFSFTLSEMFASSCFSSSIASPLKFCLEFSAWAPLFVSAVLICVCDLDSLASTLLLFCKAKMIS